MYNLKKIPFDPLRSQQPTLINITQKLAALRAFLGAWLLKCQAVANSVSFLQLEAEEMKRFKQKEMASQIINMWIWSIFTSVQSVLYWKNILEIALPSPHL